LESGFEAKILLAWTFVRALTAEPPAAATDARRSLTNKPRPTQNGRPEDRPFRCDPSLEVP